MRKFKISEIKTDKLKVVLGGELPERTKTTQGWTKELRHDRDSNPDSDIKRDLDLD